MTKREYIDATDLAKVRAACDILSDVYLFGRLELKGFLTEAARALNKIRVGLAAVVKTTEGPPDPCPESCARLTPPAALPRE